MSARSSTARLRSRSARLLAVSLAAVLLPVAAACGTDDGTTIADTTPRPTGADASRDANVATADAGDAGDAGDARGEGDASDAALDVDAPFVEASTDPTALLAAKDAFGRVALLQGVTIALVAQGVAVAERNAPVVAGRPGVLRVYVSPAVRALGDTRVTLTVEHLGAQPTVLAQTSRADVTPAEADLASTVNFDLDAATIDANARFTIAIESVDAATGAHTLVARYPDGAGSAALDAQRGGDSVRVHIVPIRYRADGTDRVPDTSAARIEAYRSPLYAAYPTARVEITVRQPITWNGAIDPMRVSDVADVLDRIIALRAEDDAPDDVYYYGLFSPRATDAAYCADGCILGVSNLVSDEDDVSHRASIGVGFPGREWTIVHEIGHDMGRRHAPCDVDSPDPGYPSTSAYAEARLGVWGFDLTTGALVDPDTSRDFMSYCKPRFVSDYTYRALFDRIAHVNRAAGIAHLRAPAPPSRYRFVRVGVDGALSWGRPFTSRTPPTSSPTAMVYLNAAGAEIARGTAYYYPLADAAGGHYVIPDEPRGFASLRIDGTSSPRGVIAAPTKGTR